MTTNPIDGAAEYLFRATQAGDKGTPLPDDLAPPDPETAYLVQDRLQAMLMDAGAGPIVGWKIALTSKVMQELLGVDIDIVSTSAERDDTIVEKHPFD